MEKKPMEKKAKVIVIISTIALILIAIYIAIYALVRTKVVEINEWFLPKNAVTGVSLSNYQGKVDMEQLKAQNIQFALIKATEGTTIQDKRFEANWENAAAAELPASAYHFFSFSSEGATQAQNFIDTVGSLDGRMIPAVDIQYTKKYS
ncbi:MAG: glycoside hydrolase family 25, partial [Clostridia bacterium]|nr:glycoside hydrolase family 25 [Clostridia bacterium]